MANILNNILKDNSQTKTDNDKAKEAGARTMNQKAAAATGYSVPERVWNFLTQEKGLSSVAAAAIMGNMQAESGYDPANVNKKSGAKGLCQWYEGRADRLDQVASSKGKSWTDVEAQLTHLWNEIGPGGAYNKYLNQLMKYDEAHLSEAVIYWEEHFEVSGDTASYPRRISAAQEALQKQGKGIIAGGTYTPSDTPANGYIGKASPAKRGISPLERIGVEQIGHTDEYRVKPLDPDKTFCEPIYPDLTSIGEEIPAYSMPASVPTSEMKLLDYDKAGAGLVYEMPTTAAISFSDDKNLGNFILQNQAVANQRKEIFNKASHRTAFKKPVAGKPPNNKDPFPVDHKVVELETHQPRCKIDSITACHHSLSVAKGLVLLSTDTEKRLVRIENNLATVMRYLYRLAGRININCVFYGGQVPCTYPAKNGDINNKYNCIRCLKDDRIQEGKQVSLDQCLNCTRYEPLIGQVYDILDNTGDNLSIILDDNQMSYTTMDEYYRFRNITERQKPMEAVKAEDMNVSGVQTRNPSEIDFDDEWGPGLAMDWSLYPVELQRPHTNPPVEGMLASGIGTNSGSALTNGGTMANMLIEARNQIDGGDSKAKSVGTEFAQSKADTIVSEMKAGRQKDIQDYYKSKNITTGQDACLIGSLMAVYGGQVGDTIDKLEKAKTEIKGKGVNNIVLHVMFYTMDQKYLFGDENKSALPKRLDEVTKSSDNSSENQNQSNNTNIPHATSGLNWSDVNKWNWNNFSEALAINISGEGIKTLPDQMLNFAKVVYLYKELLAKCSSSRFDTAEWGFPFTEEQIQDDAGIGLNYSFPFGPRNIADSANSFHYGIDIGVWQGQDAAKRGGDPSKIRGAEIHAARDGVVSWLLSASDAASGGGGNCLGIQHDNGYTTCYMHLSQVAVTQGQKVARGEVIGKTGGSGSNGPLSYAEHLHFEMRTSSGEKIDPAPFFNGLSQYLDKHLCG